MKNFDSNNDVYLALLQICSTPIGPGLPSPVSLMFSRPIRGLMPKLSRPPIWFNLEDDHYTALRERQQNADESKDTCKHSPFKPSGSLVAVQREDGGPWTQVILVGHGSEEHSKSYKIMVTRTGLSSQECNNMCKHTLIQAKDHLCDELKRNIPTHKQQTECADMIHVPHYTAIRGLWD